MPIDHSRSYSGFGLRAIGHRARLRIILRRLSALHPEPGSSYCDLGCSNGFITDQIRDKFSLIATGMDHSVEHFELGRRRHPKIKFSQINLNQTYQGALKFDLVTCFETLEHVGKPKNAIKNIVSLIAPGGTGLISVPIEHGWRGAIKYFTKKVIGGYSTDELGISDVVYIKALVSGCRLSQLRPIADGYSTHFGFDYRDIDDFLYDLRVTFRAFNSGMSRFYIISGME
jgi:SAM-dependent methyltransferase